MAFILASIIGGGAMVAGAGITNAQNANEAEKNRQFQEMQRKTQYQTATADMTAAGINPMLAYMKGGASPTGGAQATMQNPMSGMLDSAKNITSEKQRLDNETAMQEAATHKMTQEAINTSENTELARQKIMTEKVDRELLTTNAAAAAANLPAIKAHGAIDEKMAVPDAAIERIKSVVNPAGGVKDLLKPGINSNERTFLNKHYWGKQ